MCNRHVGGSYNKACVTWDYVSPTQIESYTNCPRLWWYKSIDKQQETAKGHQALGSAFHLIMEKIPQKLTYSHADINATPDDWVKAEAMAAQALPLLPVSPNIKRECGIRLPTYPNGPTMVGYIDLGIPSGVGWPAFVFPAEEAIVGDYKTLSDFRYMKTPAELADSTQMMTYAKWALDPGNLQPVSPEYVRLIHLYAKTKPPWSRQTIRNSDAVVTPAQINAKWDKTLDTVREMAKVSTCATANDVEAGGALNGHCNAYGGCSFRAKCGIGQTSGIKALFAISKKPEQKDGSPMAGSNILEKIRAAQAAAQASKAASTGQATATPVPTASVSPVGTVKSETTNAVTGSGTIVNPVNQPSSEGPKGPISALMAKIANEQGAIPGITGELGKQYAAENGYAGHSFTGGGALKDKMLTTVGELMAVATGVVPPDAPSRAQEVITRPGDIVVDPLAPVTEDDEDDTDDETETSGNQTLPNASPEAPKKRGRPSKEEMAARDAASKAAFETAVTNEVLKRMQSGTPNVSEDVSKIQEIIKDRDYWKTLANATVTTATAVQTGLTLYVDCYPSKGDRPVDFFEWIGPICAAVAKGNDVGDWRQINYTGKGLLANAIRETIKTHGLPNAMAVSTYAGGADIALEILTPIAKQVVKKL